ncbi:MAG: metallophosphatase family protein [Verrucomicrobia bacterium]|nr:metallophosphatase family protein [Verrucomicrobiota bacterium]
MNHEVAIISDIHGNLQALQAVLKDIDERGIEERICLGDIVGYGGNPAECLELIRTSGFRVVQGNHEAMVTDGSDCSHLYDDVRATILWTRSKLSPEQLAWLAELPLTLEGEDYQAVHASLHQPAKWRYLLTPEEASLHFHNQFKPVCFSGHTHQPMMWLEGEDREVGITNLENIRAGRKQAVNVGSVGQPRDRDERACYLVYRRKERDFWWRRLSYDIDGAQRAILDAGLPAKYAVRLEKGK